MESEPFEAESSSSLTSLVNRSLKLITPNTEILVITICGVIMTMVEVAGYWPRLRLQDLFPDQSEEEEGSPLRPELNNVVYTSKQPSILKTQYTETMVSDGVEVARFYSIHIYLAAYFLLPYPILMEKQKVLLVPWLLCFVLRSILLTLLQSLVGMVLCAAQDTVSFNCLQYSTINGAKLCISLFVWTSVHNFYHYLDTKKSNHEFDLVIKTIHKAGIRKIRSNSIGSSQSSSKLPLESLDEDELPGTEATLVERAAMAWIAREILEDDGEYVTDSQFSHYLTLKATMELRQITSELTERRRQMRKSSTKERIKASLEFCKKTSTHYESTSEAWLPRSEAFDESAKLSRRDPLRKIPPLVLRGRPFADDDDSIAGEGLGPLQVNPDSSGLTSQLTVSQTADLAKSAVLENPLRMIPPPVLRGKPSVGHDKSIVGEDIEPLHNTDSATSAVLKDRLQQIPSPVLQGQPFVEHDESIAEEDIGLLQINNPDIASSAVLDNSVEVQTDPLSSQMKQLFDLLDQQHAKPKAKDCSNKPNP